ncbi:hypothetical protein CHLRE_12g533450v5 [Chlamydomonas reinhardtii]|uniref:Uncharacterized protein n=1 Tax=Chlamydomonas reinhardtii TaxID=3055 RepID=A0A2K3D503_CHLRE|nr:uncharacterized protein CHLRE_12g533450v5 [Chlamydomonas reinhardtii]PNW75604.1 hypothetical protein CHLRE_12g533450v5 [Chlamydomonas reinhardtii]
MTEVVFRKIYVETGAVTLAELYVSNELPALSELPEALPTSTVKDHMLASDYVLQPTTTEAPLYIQVWEILKNLLALQVGSGGTDGEVCMGTAGVALGNARTDESDDSDDEEDWAEAPTVLADEAMLTGPQVTGRSEFVLVRAPAQRPLPICRGLEMVGRPDGLTPLLVGEVELTMNFFDQIWQPLSLALELLKRSPAQTRSVWVFLTDVKIWDFVRVDRLPCSEGVGGAAASAAAAPVTESAGATAAPPRFALKRMLAMLHHIIYPGEQHAGLQDRMARSSAALESRAKSLVNKAQILQQAQGVVEELNMANARAAKAEADAKAAKADAEAAKADAEAAKADAEAAKADAEAAKAQAEAAKADAEAAKADAEAAKAQTEAAKAQAEAANARAIKAEAELAAMKAQGGLASARTSIED